MVVRRLPLPLPAKGSPLPPLGPPLAEEGEGEGSWACRAGSSRLMAGPWLEYMVAIGARTAAARGEGWAEGSLVVRGAPGERGEPPLPREGDSDCVSWGPFAESLPASSDMRPPEGPLAGEGSGGAGSGVGEAGGS